MVGGLWSRVRVRVFWGVGLGFCSGVVGVFLLLFCWAGLRFCWGAGLVLLPP